VNDESDEQDAQDDQDLFQQAMRGVTPLKPDNRVRQKKSPRHPPARRQAMLAGEPELRFSDRIDDDACPDQLYFARAGGAQKSVLKKLRAGRLHIESRLDLHGLSVDAARRELIDFMADCKQAGYRHVIIIHGKGFRSQSKPVIKPLVKRWLQEANEVLAFCSARPKDGGSGAVYVLLRKPRDEQQDEWA
jgi:DNA-nicking Smr family endonuclease